MKALMTPRHLGQALPDRVQVSVFADCPRAHGDHVVQAHNATRYFAHRPGATFHDDPGDRIGPSFVWREGPVTLKLGVQRSFSLAAVFNCQRIVAARHGLPKARDRHGNTALSLAAEGYDLAGLRRGMAQDIVDIVARAKRRYPELVAQALGLEVVGEVQANFSLLELTYDVNVAPSVITTYDWAFHKVVGRGKGAQGLSGHLRRGENFAIYSKGPFVRFETRASGRRVKEAVGSQRVPTTAHEVSAVLDAIETRHLPVLLELERHRLPVSGGTLGQLAMRLPRVRDRHSLDRIARQLGRTGRIKSVKANRGILESLRKQGLVENLVAKTGVRGYRVSPPESELLWRAWETRA